MIQPLDFHGILVPQKYLLVFFWLQAGFLYRLKLFLELLGGSLCGVYLKKNPNVCKCVCLYVEIYPLALWDEVYHPTLLCNLVILASSFL